MSNNTNYRIKLEGREAVKDIKKVLNRRFPAYRFSVTLYAKDKRPELIVRVLRGPWRSDELLSTSMKLQVDAMLRREATGKRHYSAFKFSGIVFGGLRSPYVAAF